MPPLPALQPNNLATLPYIGVGALLAFIFTSIVNGALELVRDNSPSAVRLKNEKLSNQATEIALQSTRIADLERAERTNDGTIATLRARIQDLEGRIQRHGSVDHRYRNEIQGLNDDLSQGRDQIAQLENDNADNLSKIADLERTVGEQRDRITELETSTCTLEEMNRALQEQEDGFERENAAQRQRMEELERRESDAVDRVNIFNEQNLELTRGRRNMETEVRNLTLQLEASENTNRDLRHRFAQREEELLVIIEELEGLGPSMDLP